MNKVLFFPAVSILQHMDLPKGSTIFVTFFYITLNLNGRDKKWHVTKMTKIILSYTSYTVLFFSHQKSRGHNWLLLIYTDRNWAQTLKKD